MVRPSMVSSIVGRNLTFPNYSFLIRRRFHPGTPNKHVTSSQQSNTEFHGSWAGGSSDEEGGRITGQNWAAVSDFSGGGGGQEKHKE